LDTSSELIARYTATVAGFVLPSAMQVAAEVLERRMLMHANLKHYCHLKTDEA
jgi:hypothetical protein